MISEKLGVCVIGAGRAGLIHARNYAGAVSGARLIAIADTDENQLAEATSALDVETTYTDFREAISDDAVDAVVVVTPTKYHRDVVVAAATAGKHVFCEKPMALNVAECDEMIAAARENDVKLQIGFMRRFDKSFVDAKERIDRGEIGKVVLVKSLTRGPSIPQPWQYDIAASNGPLAEVNSHDIDTLRWLTGSEFAEVYAIAGNYRCPQARDEFPDFYDNIVMTSRFENGMQGCIDGAVSVGYGYDARVEIVGTEGLIFIGDIQDTATVVCSRENGIQSSFRESWRTLFLDAYLKEDIGFVQCIREDVLPKATGHDGKMAVAVVNAGNHSVVEGRPILLNGSDATGDNGREATIGRSVSKS